MLYFIVPYAFNGRLFEAYDKAFHLVRETDWICFLDGDVLFFPSDFGHQIKAHIQKHPDTGLFTARASRIGNPAQLVSDKTQEVDSIKWHFKISNDLRKESKGEETILRSPISGFLMVIQKRTWNQVRNRIAELCKGSQILKVDNNISQAIIENGMQIRRMDDIYLLHYYRMVEGKQKRGIK